MSEERRTFFRQAALENYSVRREKDVLLRLMAPPSFALFWLLLGLILVGLSLAWGIAVPIYTNCSGVVEHQVVWPEKSNVLLFLPRSMSSPVQVGASVQFRMVAEEQISIAGTVIKVGSQAESPVDVRQRYQLTGTQSSLIVGPVVVVQVRPVQELPSRLYGGSMVQAQIYVGSRRLLSLFPGFGWLQ
ncbi:hypothetical protein [Ktedonospora formicarum]|uniref:Uncharacterized protein n=1 Tax=Ktedonospora formicarum TaxID=2778364 RepID=A0A8J3MW31_9CHLR|nr:hypothetical protein [Ktedonospora formicarum]GHO49945.1 hypothetical protein KSX_81080 [Ktedonospora formicarum]